MVRNTLALNLTAAKRATIPNYNLDEYEKYDPQSKQHRKRWPRGLDVRHQECGSYSRTSLRFWFVEVPATSRTVRKILDGQEPATPAVPVAAIVQAPPAAAAPIVEEVTEDYGSVISGESFDWEGQPHEVAEGGGASHRNGQTTICCRRKYHSSLNPIDEVQLDLPRQTVAARVKRMRDERQAS